MCTGMRNVAESLVWKSVLKMCGSRFIDYDSSTSIGSTDVRSSLLGREEVEMTSAACGCGRSISQATIVPILKEMFVSHHWSRIVAVNCVSSGWNDNG